MSQRGREPSVATDLFPAEVEENSHTWRNSRSSA